MHRNTSLVEWNGLSSFDLVIVYSTYSSEYYSEKTNQERINILCKTQLKYPFVTIVNPPVTPVDEFKGRLLSKEQEKTLHITMIGRFFRGRHSKGHALQILPLLISGSIQHSVHLTMIRNIHPNNDSLRYLTMLKRQVLDQSLPVTVMTGVSPRDISMALTRSTVFWHLFDWSISE